MAKRRKPPLKLRKVKSLANGYIVRFKDSKGRFTTPDARKKLTTVVFKKVGKKLQKTNLTFNPTKNNKAVPKKFGKKFIMKSKILNKRGTAPLRYKTKPNIKDITVDARYPIEDNIIIKANDFLKFTRKRKKGVVLTIDYRLPDKSPMKHTFVFKNSSNNLAISEITNALVNNIYRSSYRMSSVKDTSRPENKYLRSVKTKWVWAGI